MASNGSGILGSRFLVALLGLLLASLTAHAAQPRLLQAANADVQAVATAARADASLQLRVTTPAGQSLDLMLHPQQRLTRDAARFVAGVRAGTTRLYAGKVAGQPHSWVRMTRVNGAWIGAIQTGKQLWFLDPARVHPALAARLQVPADGTLVFRRDDIVGMPLADDVRRLPPAAEAAAHSTRYAPTAQQTGPWQLRVSLVLDTEFQSHWGASAASDAVAILNIVDGFYRAQVDTRVTLYALKVLNDNGPLTSTDANDLLDAFTAYGRNGQVPFDGVAHLLSGKHFGGSLYGTTGLAWLGVLCSHTYGYGIDQITFSLAASGQTLAHEIGHNYGADHDGTGNSCPSSGFIMASVSNVGHPPSEFSSCSLDYFADYLATRAHACLAPDDHIFADGFE